MAIKVSTGLRSHMLSSGSFKNALDAGFLKIYSGAVPADADASLGAATLLCTVSVASGGTGLTFDAAVGTTITKAAAEVWSGVNAATGTASFYRFVASTDTGASSTTEKRVQGTVAVAGGDLNLSSVALVSAATQTVDYYAVSFPSF